MRKNETFAKLLKRLLEERDLKAADLSRMTGISNPSISNYINGISVPTDKNRKIILDSLGVDDQTSTAPAVSKPSYDLKDRDDIPVEVAAKFMNKSTMFVRMGLRQERFSWGYAVLMPSGKWSYWISKKRFFEETGIDPPEDI